MKKTEFFSIKNFSKIFQKMFGFFLDQKIVNAHECAKVIYENNKIFNAPRVHHESTTSAPRVHHECTTSAPRVHHERTTSAPRWHHECAKSAPRVHHEFLCRTLSIFVVYWARAFLSSLWVKFYRFWKYRYLIEFRKASDPPIFADF